MIHESANDQATATNKDKIIFGYSNFKTSIYCELKCSYQPPLTNLSKPPTPQPKVPLSPAPDPPGTPKKLTQSAESQVLYLASQKIQKIATQLTLIFYASVWSLGRYNRHRDSFSHPIFSVWTGYKAQKSDSISGEHSTSSPVTPRGGNRQCQVCCSYINYYLGKWSIFITVKSTLNLFIASYPLTNLAAANRPCLLSNAFERKGSFIYCLWRPKKGCLWRLACPVVSWSAHLIRSVQLTLHFHSSNRFQFGIIKKTCLFLFFLNKACSSVLFSDSRWLPTSEKFPADLAGELTRKSLIDVVSLDILTNQRNENLKEMATLVFWWFLIWSTIFEFCLQLTLPFFLSLSSSSSLCRLLSSRMMRTLVAGKLRRLWKWFRGLQTLRSRI